MPDVRLRTADIPPRLSKTAWSGDAIASARNEKASTRLLLPEPLRPTRKVGLSKRMCSVGMLRKRFRIRLRTTGSIATPEVLPATLRREVAFPRCPKDIARRGRWRGGGSPGCGLARRSGGRGGRLRGRCAEGASRRGRGRGLSPHGAPGRLSSDTAPALPRPRRLIAGAAIRFVESGKRASWARALGRSCSSVVGHRVGAILAEELLRPFAHGEETNDALLRLDDSGLPVREMDAERLGEATDDVVDEAEALGFFLPAAESFVLICPRRAGLRLALLARSSATTSLCSAASRERAP